MTAQRHRFPRMTASALVGVAFAIIAASAATLPAGANRSAGKTVLPRHNTFPAHVWQDQIGHVAFSSPVVAEIDGVRAVVLGTLNGYINVVNATTGRELPGWPRPVMLQAGRRSAVDSTPVVAYLDGPNREPSIVVGAGSLFERDQQGGVEAFYWNGAVRFRFYTRDTFNEWGGGPGGYDNSVFSSPAVGDITGNGQQDIVFGSYDHFIYALSPSGHVLPGFPFDNVDTVWSSPALYDSSGSGKDDIFIGGDSTGFLGCWGGWVYDLRYVLGRPRVEWRRCMAQAIWSSPAVGAINNSGRVAVVVGTSFDQVYQRPQATNRVYAFYANNGAPVPGWPVATNGPTFGSPAIGDIGGAGDPAVVDTSCAHCPNGPGRVYAWSGSGRLLWSTVLNDHEVLSSPVLVDLMGRGTNDVIAGNTLGLYLLSGRTGAFLYGTTHFPVGMPCSVQNAPAVTFIPRVGWRLFEACGGPIYAGHLIAYPLPIAPRTPPAWPQWRGSSLHNGLEGDPIAGHQVTCRASSGAQGYRVASAAGSVLGFGVAPWCGSLAGVPVTSPVIGIASMPSGGGYWLATADGGVYAFGAARLYPGKNGLPALGSMAGQPLPGRIVAIVSSRDGRGYMLAGADGSVYSFGDAPYLGSMAGVPLNKPIVGMAIDPRTGGYWLVASDGGIFSFRSHFYGSTGSLRLKKPIIGMEVDPSTGGYLLVASDGGVFAFRAHFYGSTGAMRLLNPIVGLAPDPTAGGYWMVGLGGRIYSFHAPYYGSVRSGQIHTPVVAISPST
jgi:hypothetical protein